MTTFDEIYKNNTWGDGGGSGRGSEPENAVGTIKVLDDLIDELGVQFMLDAPCGAMKWSMPYIISTLKRRPGFCYFGVDIVSSVIKKNKTLSRHPGIKFATRDIRINALPNADLTLSRDFFQHLSFFDAKAALENLMDRSKYILATSFTNTSNTDIKTGEFYPCNLEVEPFNLSPMCSFNDNRPNAVATGHKLLLLKGNR